MLRSVIVALVVSSAVVECQIKSSFSCEGRVSGYYADVGTGCQVYHMCDGLGRRFSFTCPNATLFQQRMLICDHWFMVNCSRSESQYSTNLLIGQKETPFVGESGLSSFQRTPRPDYTAIKLDKTKGIFQREESNVIPANSEEQNNVPSSWSTEYSRPEPTTDPKVEFSRREDQGKQGSNGVPPVDSLGYFQEIVKDKQVYSEIPVVNFQSTYKATTPIYPNFVEESQKLNDLDLAPPKPQPVITRIEDINNLQSTENTQDETTKPVVNFESRFKATTPVYPTFVDQSLKLDNLELSPPILQSQSENVVIDDKTQKLEEARETPVVVNFESRFKATTPVYPKFVDEALKFNDLELSPPSSYLQEAKVNFVSNFKATTPVYPLSVEATSPLPDGVGLLPPLDDIPKLNQQFAETTTKRTVNFESNFAATVPNYPTSVEPTSPSPDEAGLLPPGKIDATGRFLNFQPIDNANYQDQPKEEDRKEPSVFYEPPLFDTGYVDPNGALASYKSDYDRVVSPKIDDWNALRRRYSVPDFDFPLDSEVKRASYESDRSSFQPRPAGSQVK